MKQAIKSDSFVDFRKVIEKTKPPKDELDIAEKRFAHLAGTEDWKELKKYIDSLKESMNGLNKTMMEKGAEWEDIGKNAVIVQLANDLLSKIVTKVEDAKEAVEKQKR